MPKHGDYYQIKLTNTHIDWGKYRHTNSRTHIPFEVYIPIPRNYAILFNIFNSNKNNRLDILGINIFNCKTYVENTVFDELQLKASGCYVADDIYAKNLSGNGNLKALSHWIYACDIRVNDIVEVRFTSPTDVELRKI